MGATERMTIALSGKLEPADIERVTPHTTLDFDDVESVSFAALRSLLTRQQAGDDLDIVNASTNVYLMFDSTGMNHFIPVNLKPREFDISAFHIAGDGNLGDCYFDDEGDTMIKLYSDPRILSMARHEKRGAYAAFVSGIPTPLVGEEIAVGDKRGVIFERARNKKSISRLIVDDPDNIEKYVEIFADMAKKLHSTPCAKGLAPSATEIRRRRVLDADFVTEEQREKTLAFIDSIPSADTCVHGDLHIGNVIVSDEGPQFIDMGAFAYGNPNFDLGWTYLISYLICSMEGKARDIALAGFHLSGDVMVKVWRLFEKHYFGAETPSQIRDVEHELEPFAALKMFGMIDMLAKGDLALRDGIIHSLDEMLFSRI